MPLTKADREMLTDAVAEFTVRFVREKLQPIERRIGALERDRQAKGGGPPSPALPAVRPRVRVPATMRQL